MKNAWIIATGTELSSGLAADANSPWLAAQLAGLGIRTTRLVVIPDDPAATVAVLREAAGAGDVVLMTGGLGPTPDDHTRAALASAAGVDLVEHAASVDHLRSYFAARGRALSPANLVQALVPRGARVLPNTCGSAPGLRAEINGTPCYALPGVPGEMRVMFLNAVAPELRALATGGFLRTRTLHTFGMGESEIGTRLEDLMQPGRNPSVGTSAHFGIVDVRLYAAAGTGEQADALLDESELLVRDRLGLPVFGRDGESLAAVVGEALVRAGKTVATAESCTGGMIGSLLTDVPGSSRYFRGGIIAYDNRIKTRLLGVAEDELAARGAVSTPVASAMAAGACSILGSDYGISVTGIAGPAGGTAAKPVGLVCIGLATPQGCAAGEYRFGDDAPRELIRIRAAHTALNTLRIALLQPA